MPFVLDASVTLAWVFADENDPSATAALDHLRTDEAHVPALWWFEIRNALLVGERRGRLDRHDTRTFLDDLRLLGIAVDRTPDEARLLSLARRHRLTAYDAAYLELAQRLAFPLATLDKAVRQAATASQIALLAGG